MTPILEDGDPRLAGESDELAQSSTRAEPAVARSAQRSNTSLIAAAFVLGGVILFATLNAARAERGGDQLLQPASTAPSPMVEAPLPQGLTPTPISLIIPTTTPVPVQPAGAASYAVSPPPRFGGGGGGGGRPQVDMAARFRAPAVVVELSQATTGPSTNAILLAQAQGADGLPTGAVVLGGSAPAGRPTSTSDEQFARQVGDAEPERARATFMGALDTLVPQGTVIPGVLETAISSDLPGYTRAIVSRDVLSFDGRYVLIPRGSRIIGQYKSAVSQGQSRAFIVWTRIIRPDGVSIQIGSPGTDALGRGGLEGRVDRHYVDRFGGAILLTLLNAGVATLGQAPSTQVTIGAPAAAVGGVSSAMQGGDIPPTIKVKQGEAIRIFVSRDLDFSAVGPVR